jgi:hypothetical protein
MYQIPFPPLDLQPADPNPYYKFQIRLLRKWKQVYVGVGLPPVWTMINGLKKLVGDPLLPRPNNADWSMRQVAAIAAGQPPVPVNLTPVSLVAVARFLQNTIPSDTPPPPPPLGHSPTTSHFGAFLNRRGVRCNGLGRCSGLRPSALQPEIMAILQ